RRLRDARRCLGVDGIAVSPVPAIRAAERRCRGVQRQVHVRPTRVARSLRGHAGGARTADVPQLFPGLVALGIQRPAPGPKRRLMTTAVQSHIAVDAEAGLWRTPPSMPARWFYDDRGSRLFDEITRLPEYYPTRRETEILRA